MRIRNKELNKQIAEGDGPVPGRADEGSVVNMPGRTMPRLIYK